MVNKHLCVFIGVKYSGCEFGKAAKSLLSIGNQTMHFKLAVYLIVYNCEKYKYEAIYTQHKIFRLNAK